MKSNVNENRLISVENVFIYSHGNRAEMFRFSKLVWHRFIHHAFIYLILFITIAQYN